MILFNNFFPLHYINIFALETFHQVLKNLHFAACNHFVIGYEIHGNKEFLCFYIKLPDIQHYA